MFGAVAVATEAGSRVAALVGASLTVNCHHHQSVRDHPGFVAVGARRGRHARGDGGRGRRPVLRGRAVAPGDGRRRRAARRAGPGRGGVPVMRSVVEAGRRRDPVLISAHRFGAGKDRDRENSLAALERSLDARGGLRRVRRAAVRRRDLRGRPRPRVGSVTTTSRSRHSRPPSSRSWPGPWCATTRCWPRSTGGPGRTST